MYDCHLFHKLTSKTVDEVIDEWRSHNELDARPATIGDTYFDDLGKSSLCPATQSPAEKLKIIIG